MNCYTWTIDSSCFAVKQRHQLEVGWTKYSDFYEIIHPSLYLIFLKFADWSGMRERSIIVHKEFILPKTRSYDLDLDFPSRGGENL